MSRPVKWVVVLLALALTLPLLAGIFVYVAVNGGIYGTILNMKARPDLDSLAIKQARAKLEADIDAAFHDVVAGSHFAPDDQSSRQDLCYDGQNNYAMSDGYAHRCSLRVTRFYGFDGDFRQKMIDFEKTIIAAGWHFGLGNGEGRSAFPGQDMEDYMKNYFDARPNLTLDQIAGPLGYSRGALDLRIKWAERNTRDRRAFDGIEVIDRPFAFYNQHQVRDKDGLFANVTREHRYILAIAVQGNYFEN
jgi:hypothetical protein